MRGHPVEGVTVVVLRDSSFGDGRWTDLAQQIAAAKQAVDIRGIVVYLESEPGGAMSVAHSDGMPNPFLNELIEGIEASRLPVVSALQGGVLGSALEFALACHSRVALATARVSFPAVALGLIPGQGGTQRLPRLVGIELALSMLMQGDIRSAQELSESGLLDEVVDADVLGAASRRALTLADGRAQLASAPVDRA